MRALAEHGPCPEHRMSFANVAGRAPAPGEPGGRGGPEPGRRTEPVTLAGSSRRTRLRPWAEEHAGTGHNVYG